MKKSTLLAILVFLSAVAGALGAMFLYLRRREAELEEYERLLFSEDFSYEQAEAIEDEPEEADFAEEAVPAVPAQIVKAEKPTAKKAPAKKAGK